MELLEVDLPKQTHTCSLTSVRPLIKLPDKNRGKSMRFDRDQLRVTIGESNHQENQVAALWETAKRLSTPEEVWSL